MLKRITTTGAEPVSVAEAKLAARIDYDDLDTLIADYISTARRQAEQVTGRAYISGLWRWSGSDWPCSTIPITDVQSATVKRWNGSALVALDPAAFVWAESADQHGTDVVPALGAAWPDLPSIATGARVQIDLTVARAPADVPSCVKDYIKAQVSGWVNNPDAVNSRQLQTDPRLDRLLDSELVWF